MRMCIRLKLFAQENGFGLLFYLVHADAQKALAEYMSLPSFDPAEIVSAVKITLCL